MKLGSECFGRVFRIDKLRVQCTFNLALAT